MQTAQQPAAAPKAKSGTWKLIAIIVVILIVVGVAAYIYTMPKTTTTVDVVIQDDTACSLNDAACKYAPTTFNVTAGGTVTWRNDGGITHTVTNSTGNTGTDQFDSNNVAHGQSYSHTFSAKGTYHYFCKIHPWMTGIIYAN